MWRRIDAAMASRDPSDGAHTWHHGVVARWWAEFNTDGPEIDFYRRYVEAGQPALDVGCGTGRLLIPYLSAGLDVDGCDASADMIALCRERAEREGVSTELRVQAIHELDMPRTYRTVIVCGTFGLGADRARDEEGLRRLRDHLEPGGTLLLDSEPPYSDEGLWASWARSKREELPSGWDEPGMRRTSDDGTEYELIGRLVEVDPFVQRVTMEMRGRMSRDGRVVQEDDVHVLDMIQYFPHEIELMLERAGFSDIRMLGDHSEEPATGRSETVVFVATA
jgi:SAM-dependent methyltransferase